MKYAVTEITKAEIVKIKHLWQKLNEIHLQDANNFKEHYKNFTFEKRCEKFKSVEEENMLIEIAGMGDAIVGYCVTTCEKGVGEIESLFVEESQRKKGLGKKLIKNSLKWLAGKKCEKIQVAVSEGHEAVFSFYGQFGFYPRMTYLQLKGTFKS